ncbi:hypothetical protein D3C78_1144490 [compost metagenome]
MFQLVVVEWRVLRAVVVISTGAEVAAPGVEIRVFAVHHRVLISMKAQQVEDGDVTANAAIAQSFFALFRFARAGQLEAIFQLVQGVRLAA